MKDDWLKWWMLGCLTLTLTPGHVQRIVDGDTFVLYHVGTPPYERIRLLGVDADERATPNGIEATLFVEEWLEGGDWSLVTCARDSFGRLLGTVTRDGESLADLLIGAGLATRR